MPRTIVFFILGFCLLAAPGEAGQSADATGSGPSFDLPADFDGPAPPIAPAVITRDASGRATIRAVRIATPLRIDGALDEALYSNVAPISEFIQQEPREGEPATEKWFQTRLKNNLPYDHLVRQLITPAPAAGGGDPPNVFDQINA